MNDKEREIVYEFPVEESTDEEGYEIAPVTEQAPRIGLTEKGAEAAAQAGTQAGIAARRLLMGLGSKLETPVPPKDDLSDLFEGPQPEDNDIYIRDLVTVSEADVLGDGDPEMRDLLEVDDEDIMGAEEDPEKPTTRRLVPQRSPITRRQPPSGIAGLR